MSLRPSRGNVKLRPLQYNSNVDSTMVIFDSTEVSVESRVFICDIMLRGGYG